jgi:hypothetical protein
VRLGHQVPFSNRRTGLRLRPFVAVQFTPTGADFAGALHCFPTLPNVRVKWPTTAWCLGRVDDDKQHGRAAKGATPLAVHLNEGLGSACHAFALAFRLATMATHAR